MKSILFRNVRIIDRNSPHHGQTVDVLLEAGKITRIGSGIDASGIDADAICEGHFLSPGWIDMRVHLTDPGKEYKEDLSSLARAGQRGGFTALVTLPNTQPLIGDHGQVKALLSRAADLPLQILPTGILSEGLHGKDLADAYDMHQAGAVAFTDGLHSITSPGMLLRALQYLKAFNGLVMDAPLLENLVPGAEVGEGVSSTRIGLKGLPALAESLAVERDLQIMDYFPGRLHLGPITTKASLDRIRQIKGKFPELSVETSVYYLAENETAIESFDVNTKVWPPLRTEEDRCALWEGLADGTIDVVSSNHHPQSVEEKKHDFVRAEHGASLVEVAFSAARKAQLESKGKSSLEDLVASFSTGPAGALKLNNRVIEEGNALDLTWFDPELVHSLNAKELVSKGKNNPFAGKSLTGKALATVYKGLLIPCP